MEENSGNEMSGEDQVNPHDLVGVTGIIAAQNEEILKKKVIKCESI